MYSLYVSFSCVRFRFFNYYHAELLAAKNIPKMIYYSVEWDVTHSITLYMVPCCEHFEHPAFWLSNKNNK